MARYGDELEAVRTAALSGDKAGMARANAGVAPAGAAAAQISKQLGLTHCFQ